MANIKHYLVGLLATGLVLALGACNLKSGTPTSSNEPQLIYTAAAQTVQAQLTQAAVGTPVVAPTQLFVTPVVPTTVPPTAVILPSNTPQPTAIPPTPIPPTSTQVPVPCDRGNFVTDVTYPDNTEVAAGATFVKTWRLRNNGSCTWNSGYSLVFDSGDAMNGPASTQLTTGTVPPGQEIDVSVTLKAPDTAKTYQGFWKLRNGSGAVFGIGANAQTAFWVKVKVINPVTPTPVASITFDLISKAASAEWRNDAGTIPWGDQDNDGPGIATTLDSVKLEDNKTYSRVLATYPHRVDNGYIQGVFPSYVVQNNDKLRFLVGLKASCTGGKVRFQVKYREGATDTLLGEWVKTCDGSLLAVEKDLSPLAGKTVQLVLIVSTEGAFDNDFALWVNPRIEH